MSGGIERSIALWRRIGASSFAVAAIDLACLLLAVWIAFSMRLTVYLPEFYQPLFVTFALIFVACQFCLFAVCGVYRVYWPYASLEELLLLARSYLYGFLLFLVQQLFFNDLPGLPRIIPVITALLGGGLLLFTRLSWRLARHHTDADEPERVLIVGAGEAGNMLARDLIRQGERANILGFVDDDDAKKGKKVAGVKVYGPLNNLPALVKRLHPEAVLVAMPSAPKAIVRTVVDALIPLDVKVRILPSMKDLAKGSVAVSQLRPLSLADLLARDPVPIDQGQIEELVRGRSVMVTGAGGSIGSEIVRQLLKHGPRKLVLLGHGENSIYLLLEELAPSAGETELVPVIADVADRSTMEAVFETHRPSLIFHAGAHKHVPLMEANPREAVRVNGLGTWVLADLAGKWKAGRMVLISTDKAVNPSSVMGATKRLAELVIQDAQRRYAGTAYMAVRFGNVLGSRGSCIPKFERQIAAGGPVTVTHPDMRRYFMLIPEAASLVLQAGAMGTGGSIYVLDMGEPVKIVDLARTMIHLHGMTPGRDIEVTFTGMRPGEKLFEELFYDPDHVERTTNPKIFTARMDEAPSGCPMIERVRGILEADDVHQAIGVVVPEYSRGHGDREV